MTGVGDGPLVVTIAGELVALGPLRRDLVPLYARWQNDPGTTRTLRGHGPFTVDAILADYERAGRDDRAVGFTIYAREGLVPIGSAGLHDIDWLHRTAEFVVVIGEPAARGKGYGTEVARLILDYAFTALGLENVMLRVYAYNLAGQRAYEKAGFRPIGRRRGAHQLAGRAWDVILMDALASEFVSPVLGAIFAPDQPRDGGGR